MLKVFLFVLAQLCSLAVMAGVEPTFHSVSPKDGDGIYALLRRYGLDNDCDRTKFLELNKLSKTDPIHSDKDYTLPVYIYQYNGKSIRSTINDNDWDRAVRIKRYNESLKTNGLRTSTYSASKILWVPYSEIHCKEAAGTVAKSATDAVPTPAKKEALKTVDLFGSKYSKFAIEDNSLKGKVYYVVSGHGGPDPGARCLNCPSTLCEDEYAYDIALRLARNLMQHGATVHMVIQDKNDGIRDEKYLKCDRDEQSMNGEVIPLKQKARLVQRAADINRLYRKYNAEGVKEQTAIFLHVDSNTEHKEQDVYFYHHKKSKSGKKLAKQIRDTFKDKYAQYQKGRGYKGYVKPRGLYVLNYTQPTAVFVELANIRNTANHERLVKSVNRQALANWLYEGLIK